ncbi:MAG: serpin family protein, partial [Chloroflexota bacterium]|nr:serpin family protein [Chloroflexota bacterium]
MLRRVIVLLGLVVAGLVGSHSHLRTAQAHHLHVSGCEPAAPHHSGSAGSLAAIQNAFGFSLFDRLVAGHAQSNVFLSPASVALALDMAYDGARGSTRQAMA